MTNQKYIEEIIKVAREGDYKPRGIEFGISKGGWVSFESMLNLVPKEEMFLDPNFFRAIGKVKGWEKKKVIDCDFCYNDTPTSTSHFNYTENVAMNFYEINLEKDLDHAIEWLYKLIKE